MARKYQEGEPMRTCAVHMGTRMLARIDAYGARLKAQHPGIRVERADAVRDLLLTALALVEGNGSGDAGGGPGEAPVPLGEPPGADHSPHGEALSAPKAAPGQDPQRTPGRTGGKRPAAVRG